MAKLKWPRKAGKHLFIPLFGGNFWVFYDEESFQQAMDVCGAGRVEGIEYFGGMCQEVASPDGFMVVVGVFDHEPSVVCHECVHAASAVLRHAGVEDEETMAYMTHTLFSHAYNNLPKEPENETTNP